MKKSKEKCKKCKGNGYVVYYTQRYHNAPYSEFDTPEKNPELFNERSEKCDICSGSGWVNLDEY
jgi:DnaJ-class molecular chaperone